MNILYTIENFSNATVLKNGAAFMSFPNILRSVRAPAGEINGRDRKGEGRGERRRKRANEKGIVASTIIKRALLPGSLATCPFFPCGCNSQSSVSRK